MATDINRCFMRFEDRAERVSSEMIAETFVSVGPLIDILSSKNNQIMYGRRGTGKTHALRFFQNDRTSNGDIAVYIDAQNLGSNGSIYNDSSLPLRERATRLLVDVCCSLHQHLLDVFTSPKSIWDLSKATPLLDNLIDSFFSTRIVSGEVEEEHARSTSSGFKSLSELKFSLSPSSSLSGSLSDESSTGSSDSDRRKEAGIEESWIDFTYLSRNLRAIVEFINPVRLYILIDEWSTIPMEIQPYLADMIRRSLFVLPNVTVKIAAIEHRTSFKLDRGNGGYIGFELGADISAALNLDDYLVIDNDVDRAKEFFKNFISNHTASISREIKVEVPFGQALFDKAFTQQENVFMEFVRASEGVPRDALHILSAAAQKANTKPISMPILHSAAHSFFLTDKFNSILANNSNRRMLDWIRDEVIGRRQTRAFLLKVGEEDRIIDALFDRRALHILSRSRSAAHRPGDRFIVYKLDYGLYIDLIHSNKYPKGLLVNDENGEGDIDFDVPVDDARSFRRAVLDVDKFYESNPDIDR